MSENPEPSFQRHTLEIDLNRASWARRPALRAVYHRFHALIASRLNRDGNGPTVELGSGIGAIKETIPDCVTTDVCPNPGVDRVENAYDLSFGAGTVSNLILFDVWHHLRYPAVALREFRRVLGPQGRVILFEPAMSWTGRIAYGLFHPEPLGMGEPLAWDVPPGEPVRTDYFAAQGAASRAFWRGQAAGRLQGLRLREATPLTAFDYLASGGFSGPALAGPLLAGPLRQLNRAAAFAPGLFAARLLVVLEREDRS